jgi:hypothetical protein
MEYKCHDASIRDNSSFRNTEQHLPKKMDIREWAADRINGDASKGEKTVDVAGGSASNKRDALAAAVLPPQEVAT